MIQEDILLRYGAEEMTVKKNELIFSVGKPANYYYQIVRGGVKMFNLSEDGKEFVQGIFSAKNSFGEPPLFGTFPYPASATATKPSRILRLPKKSLMELLKMNPEIHLHLTEILCNRLHYKSMIMKEVSVYPPEHRILTFLTYLKKEKNPETPYVVPLTRRQIAELVGLRVETVIRAIKKLEADKKLAIQDRKILL